MGLTTDRLKLRHLRTVLTVADCGSVTAAARRLFVSQAAVSKTISEAEIVLGTALFQRSGRAIVPTEAGERFVRAGRRVAAELDGLGEEIGLMASGGKGLLRIGLQVISARDLLVQAVCQLQERYPETVVQLRDGLLPELLLDLRAGSLDLVLGRMVPSLLAPDLAGGPVAMSEPYVVIASPRHPVLAMAELQWADLLAYSWCLPLKETPVRRHFDAFLTEQSLSPPVRSVETNSIETLLMLLEARPLVAIAARSRAQDWASRGQVGITSLVMLPQPDPIGIIWSGKAAPAPLARFFRDRLLALAKGESTAPGDGGQPFGRAAGEAD